jgi:hypothetical protein
MSTPTFVFSPSGQEVRLWEVCLPSEKSEFLAITAHLAREALVMGSGISQQLTCGSCAHFPERRFCGG